MQYFLGTNLYFQLFFGYKFVPTFVNWVQIHTLCSIFLASRLGCNYFVVSHKTGKGLIPTQGRGHPSKQGNNALNDEMDEIVLLPNFPQDREKELMDLHRSLFVKDDSKVLLLVSICTDDMIKLVAMHPKVWFMDVTSSVNKQKSDLFMLAIRTPSGRTFPGNFTFIPSGKAWVFQCIYQYAFMALFGRTACSPTIIYHCLMMTCLSMVLSKLA